MWIEYKRKQDLFFTIFSVLKMFPLDGRTRSTLVIPVFQANCILLMTNAVYCKFPFICRFCHVYYSTLSLYGMEFHRYLLQPDAFASQLSVLTSINVDRLNRPKKSTLRTAGYF